MHASRLLRITGLLLGSTGIAAAQEVVSDPIVVAYVGTACLSATVYDEGGACVALRLASSEPGDLRGDVEIVRPSPHGVGEVAPSHGPRPADLPGERVTWISGGTTSMCGWFVRDRDSTYYRLNGTRGGSIAGQTCGLPETTMYATAAVLGDDTVGLASLESERPGDAPRLCFRVLSRLGFEGFRSGVLAANCAPAVAREPNTERFLVAHVSAPRPGAFELCIQSVDPRAPVSSKPEVLATLETAPRDGPALVASKDVALVAWEAQGRILVTRLDTRTPVELGSGRSPRLCVRSGEVFALYEAEEGVFATASTDGGRTFGRPARVDESPAGARATGLSLSAYGPSTGIWAAWLEVDGGEEGTLRRVLIRHVSVRR